MRRAYLSYVSKLKNGAMTMIKKFMKGYLLHNLRKIEKRQVASVKLLERAMDDVMYKHKLYLRELLWITWKYS